MKTYNGLRKYFALIAFIVSIIVASKISPNEYIFSPVAKSSANILFNPEDPLENQLYLGSALGYFNRPGFYGGYNRITKGNEFWGSFFLPRSEGVFGVTYLHSANESSEKLSHGLIQLGFGKSLTENLSVGFFINYSYNDLINVNSIFSIEPAFIYNMDRKAKPANVFDIHNFFIYSTIRQINVYNSSKDAFNPSFHLGFGAKLLKINEFYAGLQVEDSIDVKRRITPLSMGINLGYSIFQVRGGYRLEVPLDKNKVQAGDFTLGGGINYAPKNSLSGISFNAQYGITGFKTGMFEHFMAAGVIFNYEDKTAPQLKITTDYNYFSPNGDGNQDIVVFHFDIKDKSPITEWKLVIKNDRGEIVKTFAKDHRSRSVYFPLYRIFTDLLKRSEYRYIPDNIIWDGSSEKLNTIASPLVNQPLIKLPEGPYFYEMSVTDEKGMTSNSSNGTIHIDNTYPDIALKRESKSENVFQNKSEKIFLAVSQFISSRDEEYFTGTIYNDFGKVVKSFNWKNAAEVPRLLTWNGMDNKNIPVKEGIYRYELKGIDAAGNQSILKIDHINIFWGNVLCDVISDTPGISPNEDGLFDKVNFTPEFINNDNTQNNLASWKIYLTRKKIKDLEGFINTKKINIGETSDANVNLDPKIQDPLSLEYIHIWSGDKSNFSNQLTWDGKNKNGNLSDGYYYLTLVVKTSSGLYFKSEGTEISLDTKPPKVIIVPEENSLTPDGDDVHDRMFLKSVYHDQSEVKNYALTLYEIIKINGIKTRVPFKTWTGKRTIPEKFYIDGISDQGLGMESLKKYEYEIQVFDIYENSIKTAIGYFHTGVIVNNYGSFLKITLTGLDKNNIYSFANLLKLNQIFNVWVGDYPDYRIRVEGHSASAGDEEANIKESEQRAKKIMQYFINKGVSSNKIGFQGYGEVLPLTEVENAINDYKNDRVDFILIK
ncbi:MAG: OmpA family protein [Spirochaetia bacterium]|nr:OmpA family protein [Spirochaetia bacterium]